MVHVEAERVLVCADLDRDAAEQRRAGEIERLFVGHPQRRGDIVGTRTHDAEWRREPVVNDLHQRAIAQLERAAQRFVAVHQLAERARERRVIERLVHVHVKDRVVARALLLELVEKPEPLLPFARGMERALDRARQPGQAGRGGIFGAELREQVLRDRNAARVLERERGRQRPAGQRGEAVAQLDGHQRVQTEIKKLLIIGNGRVLIQLLAFVLCVVAYVYAWRRVEAEQRERLRWLFVGLACGVVGLGMTVGAIALNLTVTDPSPTAPGHLVNGAFSLPRPLQELGVVKTWTAPVSNDAVTIAFKQHIGATEPLRTGTYSKTLTFTLSTTTP